MAQGEIVLPRVKICGIVDVRDLTTALDGGADAVGFLVGQKHPSRDFIDPTLARDLAQSVPPYVTCVLVTHEVSIDEILALARAIPTHVVQLHSDLEPSDLSSARELLKPRGIIGKVTVEDESCITRLLEIQSSVDAILLDSVNRITGQVGGTGLTHDWNISAHLRRISARPIILAGGLRPSNVHQAVLAVDPAAVDVNSGVESKDGKKDLRLVKEFVASARIG
jgi:phosphoribosylanthranilate isomerase